MNILIIRLSALGDVAMTIPALYSVAKAFPQHRFFVLTTSFCARLFLHRPENIIMLTVEPREVLGFLGTVRLLCKLAEFHFSAVADLHNVLRSWIIDWVLFAGGAKVAMLDKNRMQRREILSHRQVSSRPFVLRYMDVFARLGLSTEMTFTSLFPEDLPPFPAQGISAKGTQHWVGIAPFSRYQTKIYPLALMKKVVQQLSHRADTVLFLFGARGAEAEELEKWTIGYPNVISVAGNMTLEEELALMAHLDVMLTMDSANMHLASLVDTRVVSIWGSTTPACGFMGFGQKGEDALVAGLPCQPCSIAGCKRCHRGNNACMGALSPDDIVQIIS